MARVLLLLLLLAQMMILGASQSRAETSCCSTPDCVAAYTGNRVALVVGVDAYALERTGVKPLQNAVNDARTIAKILKEQDFSVICLENATRLQVMDALEKLGKHMKMREDEVGLINGLVSIVYFAGHGFATQSSDFLLLAPESCEDQGNCHRPDVGQLSLKVSELDSLVTRWGSLGFDRVVIVDACRTPLENGVGNIAGPGAAHFGRYERTAPASNAAFFLSTTNGEVAVDHNERIGAHGNGLFVSRLKHILAFDRIGLDNVAHTTAAAFALLDDNTVRQRPSPPQSYGFVSNDNLRARPGHDSTCSKAFDNHVINFSQCSEVRGECAQQFCDLARTFCDGGAECMPAADQTCLRPLLAGIRPNYQEFCRGIAPGTQRFARIIREPVFSAVVSAQLESFSRASRQTAVQNRQLESIATADLASRMPDQAAREVLRRPLSPITRAPFTLTVDGARAIRVRELPNADAGIKRIAAPGDRLFADCFSQPCPEGWMGVRLHSEGEIYRGWIPFDEAATLATVGTADEVFRLGFSGGTSRPNNADLQMLIARIRQIGRGRELAASIVVTQPGVGRNAAAYADARVARLQRTLEQSGVPIQNIAPAIEVVAASSQPTGTVRLSIR